MFLLYLWIYCICVCSLNTVRVEKRISNWTKFSLFWYQSSIRGPSIKDVRTKSRKIDPLPLGRKMSAFSLLYVRTHHKFRKIRSSFAPKSTDVHIWSTPSLPLCIGQTSSPWLRTSFMDGLLPDYGSSRVSFRLRSSNIEISSHSFELLQDKRKTCKLIIL